MRIIFMGTPDFAVPALEALNQAGHDICAVYTQPPRPGGRRGRELTPSPVQRAAQAHGIEVRCPVSLKGADEQADFAALGADVAVVAAYGLILPHAVLDAPTRGCINIHASLLPRWRGAAPIQRAILAGDEKTGVCIMQMEAGLDTGPVLLREATPVGSKTAGELTAELAETGARLTVRVLADLPAFAPVAQPDDGVTYAKKIEKAEARLDFGHRAEELERQVRAFAPSPGAWFELSGERIKVLAADIVAFSRHPREGGDLSPGSAHAIAPELDSRLRGNDEAGVVLGDDLTIACGSGGTIRPTLVQRAGKPVMSASDFLRGWPIPAGSRIA
jgi:methionyl-tRNA formyltransferase